MCFVLPKKVKQVKGGRVIFEGGERAKLGAVSKAKHGDYLLVYGDMVVEKIAKKRALEIRRLAAFQT